MSVPLSTPMGEVSIRIAEIDDATSLLELRLEALARHPDAFAADLDKTAANGVEAWVERIRDYASDESGAIVIACAGERLIGMSGIVRGHWEKTRHSGSLWGVYVTPDWRACQIGEAIVRNCLDWAVDNGLTVVNLGVVISNTPAIRCYARCGFTVFGIQPKVTYYAGVYHDELLMVKLL